MKTSILWTALVRNKDIYFYCINVVYYIVFAKNHRDRVQTAVVVIARLKYFKFPRECVILCALDIKGY